MSQTIGWVVVDREPGRPWWLDHAGPPWPTRAAAQVEIEKLAAEGDGLEFAIARVVIDDEDTQ